MKNFWYYHKYQVLIGFGILILCAYYLSELLGKREPDYELALVCSQTVGDEFRAALETGLEEKLAEKLTDVNGDGTVMVRVNSYYFGAKDSFEEERDADRLMGGAVQLAADLKLGISMVYITDQVNALVGGAEGEFQDEWLKWTDFQILEDLKLPENVNASLATEDLTGQLVVGLRKEGLIHEEYLERGWELWNALK